MRRFGSALTSASPSQGLRSQLRLLGVQRQDDDRASARPRVAELDVRLELTDEHIDQGAAATSVRRSPLREADAVVLDHDADGVIQPAPLEGELSFPSVRKGML